MMLRGIVMHLLLVSLLLNIAFCEEGEPEAEAEAEAEAEVHTTTSAHDEPVYAEPVPKWTDNSPLGGPAWDVHIYGFGAAFGVVALYSFISIVRLWKRKHLLSQRFFVALCSIVFIMSTSRCVYLLVDAYDRKQLFPRHMAYVLYTIVFPCITSAFSLLFMALLSATQLKFMPAAIQKTWMIVAVCATHFVLAITADLLLSFHVESRILTFVCQVFYLIWGLFMFVGFTVIFRRLYTAAQSRQKLMNKFTLRRFGLSAKQHNKPHRLTLCLATKVTLVTALLGVCTAGLHLYGMIDVYGVFAVEKPEAWQWWALHTGFRLVEFLMCTTIIYVATQPFRYPTRDDEEKTGSTCSNCFLCAPCWSWCHKDSEYLLPETGWSEFSNDNDPNNSLKRNESQKGDYPLNHIVRGSMEPTSPTYIKTPMLRADHGELHFSNRNSNSITKLNIGDMEACENPNYFHSESNITDQTTLKIQRELQQGESSEDENSDMEALLTSRQRSDSKEELERIQDSMSVSQSLGDLDTISQMSPELDISSGEEEHFSADV